MRRKICIVPGVGPGNGTAFTRKVAEAGYKVAMLGRGEDRLRSLEKEIPGTTGYTVGIGDREQVFSAVERIGKELGPANVLIHNGVVSNAYFLIRR